MAVALAVVRTGYGLRIDGDEELVEAAAAALLDGDERSQTDPACTDGTPQGCS